MTIQIPDPGTGNGQTGDNEYVFRKKVQNNFSDQTNAASRLVGESYGNVMQVGAFGLGKYRTDVFKNSQDMTVNHFFVGDPAELPPQWAATENMGGWVVNRGNRPLAFVFGNREELFVSKYTGVEWGVLTEFYTSANTTTDGNGYIKPSSPVLRVFNDHIEGNTDGDTMAATYTKNGVGDYTISGTTGLRTDGWYITIPNDMNGNPKVAVTLDDTNGVITLRSYVRIFDMNTFKFVPDLNQPLDIPDGRWIDLRFNDLPAEPMPPEV